MNRADAAQARAAGVRARADRPAQRRSLPARSSSSRVSVPAAMEVRSNDAGTPELFRGMASVTEKAYDMWDSFGPYVEVVSRGAFGPSLNRSDLDVPLVLAHDDIRRLASTPNGSLTLTEVTTGDHTGLLAEAPPNLRDLDWQYILPKLERGPNGEPPLVQEMSFKFTITRGIWSPDYTEFRIDEVDLHRGDVAICGYGANPWTAGAGMTSDDAGERSVSVPDQRASARLDLLRREALRDLVRS